MAKRKLNVTLSDDCQKLLLQLAARRGLSRAGVIEIAIRRLAERDKENDAIAGEVFRSVKKVGQGLFNKGTTASRAK